jgi:glutaredoxin
MIEFGKRDLRWMSMRGTWLVCVSIIWLCCSGAGFESQLSAQDAKPDGSSQCIIVELYLADDQAESKLASEAAKKVSSSRPGLLLVTRSVTSDPAAQERLQRISSYYRLTESTTPLIYCCNRAIRSCPTANDFERQLQDALRVEIFTRTGCPHCDAAKSYLPSLLKKFPGLEVTYRDIGVDAGAMNDLNELVRMHRKAATSTPVFHVCNQLLVGFDRVETTGARLEKALQIWTTNCPPPETSEVPAKDSEPSPNAVQEVTATAPFSPPRSR